MLINLADNINASINVYRQFFNEYDSSYIINLCKINGTVNTCGEKLYLPEGSSFPIPVQVNEHWGSATAVWTWFIENPYAAADRIGLDVSKAFASDADGKFTYSAAASAFQPTSSVTPYFANSYTAFVSGGVVTITLDQTATRPPDGLSLIHI